MRFTSTRKGQERATSSSYYTYEETLFMGIAPDGGLFVPCEIPPFINNGHSDSFTYKEIVCDVVSLFVDESEMTKEELKMIVEDCFQSAKWNGKEEVIPIVNLDNTLNNQLHVAELFHGESLAFKDLSLQFLSRCLLHFLQKKQKKNLSSSTTTSPSTTMAKKVNILVATSGDTGASAIAAFKSNPFVNIFVVFPYGKITEEQQASMVNVQDDNVFPIAVGNSDSDQLDIVVRAIFDNVELRDKYSLCSVNSFNWTRVMIQIAHYIYVLKNTINNYNKNNNVGNRTNSRNQKRIIRFYVPTGAMGNAAAGFIASKMIENYYSKDIVISIILTTNSNSEIFNYIQAGTMETAISPLIPSVCPSMDISVPYGLERILYFAKKINNNNNSNNNNNNNNNNVDIIDVESEYKFLELLKLLGSGKRFTPPKNIQDVISKHFRAFKSTDDVTAIACRDGLQRFNYLFDPHSATSFAAWLNDNNNNSSSSSSSSSSSGSSSSSNRKSDDDDVITSIILASAHPAKFLPNVRKMLERDNLLQLMNQSKLSSTPKKFQQLIETPKENIRRRFDTSQSNLFVYLVELMKSANANDGCSTSKYSSKL